ncbi:choice-of-anchor D domain-containing protein [Prosthecobacter dejongeii]|uniref:Ig-like domain-containing protein n=1 Tax=Prosthecobacter dejongeii TaxID=48465 RepID=A0A7W7YJP7_9BACT|nr:choice-of-anchor D domain-containing protein [Prosthecobacter dejongeii]MBB5037480.1 hypothetical protein [Prosthecobacter dejongeii]
MKAALLLTLALASSAWAQGTTLYSTGAPTDEEQLYLEMINRGRANPTAEGQRLAATTDEAVRAAMDGFQVDVPLMLQEFAALPVRPPLAMNAQLTQMARGHTQDMLDHAFQGHTSSNGDDLGDRVIRVGYPFTALGENVFSFSQSVFHGHAGFQVDWGNDGDNDGMQDPRGHRESIHGDFREVGIGVLKGTNFNATTQQGVGPQLVTQNFGSQVSSLAYVTGVAFYDLNGNDFYDLGEGIGGLTVNVAGSSFHAITANSGGYAVPVPTANANRTVTFSGLGANATAQANIVGGANVKVDFKPAFVSPLPTGSVAPLAGTAAAYTFPAVTGATAYQWEALAPQAAANDGAESLTRVTQATTGTYSPRSTTVKHAGTAAYRLTHPEVAYTAERLTYPETFVVQAGGQMSFRSRLRFATENQVAKVQVTADGGTHWVDVYAQPGATPSGQSSVAGEASFQLRTVSLAAFVGKHVQIRFNYEVQGGDFFPGTDAALGWYVDEVTFSQVLDATSGVVAAVTPGQTGFQFTPPATGRYLLSVRPIISGRTWPFSLPLEVNAQLPPVDITLLLPSQPAFVPGAASLAFQSVGVGTSATQTLIIQNSGTENLTSLAVEVTGTHAADFTVGSLASSTLGAGGEMQVPLTFAPQATGARTATLRVLSNDPDESPFLISLSGQGSNALSIALPPRSQVVKLGSTATLSVTAGPDVQSYLWRKNSRPVPGATGASLTFTSTQLTDAGTYTVHVTGGQPVSSLDSSAARLAVVEDSEKTLALQERKAVTLTAKAAGPNLQYEWKKVGGPSLEEGPNLMGKFTPSLTLKNLLTAQSGTYVCEVKTGDSTATAGATTHLRIYHDVPIVNATQNLKEGIVGGSFYHVIRTSELVHKTPLSYAAKNLPPGLKVNAKTGEITGIPTKPGTYEEVLLIATNGVGSGQSRQTITIEPYPTGLAGAYVGLAERHAVVNQRLGQRLDLTLTSLGGFSGSLTQGSVKMPFKGQLTLVSGGAALPFGQVQIQPPGKPLPAPLTLTFEVDFANHRLTQASVAASGQQVPLTAWHQKWNAKGPAASAFQGLHTFGLRLKEASGLTGDADVPQGWGYGSFTPLADGKLIAAGRTADGEKFTCASVLGPQGEVLMYQALYTTPVKGSLLGLLTLDPEMLNDPDDNTVTGALTWTRPASALASARLYKAGFGLPGTPEEDPVPLEAVGARHVPPVGPTDVILNLQAGVQNGRVEFDFAEIETTSDNPDQDLNIALKSKITAFAPASNPAATRLSAVVTTGLLSGSFTLTDAPSAGAKEIKRSVTLQGLLIREGVNYRGVGYFLLPALPSPGGPVATPILSGSVLLRPQ